jgi:hypothetical protein
MPAPIPPDEELRLEVLRQYQILDTAAEQVFDDITNLAADVCQTPISILAFVDRNRQWFKSKVGITALETSRDLSFCAYAILQDDLFVIPDARRDERFSDHPLVIQEPNLRFYASMPLISRDGLALGSLCVADQKPRDLTPGQEARLRSLAASVLLLLEMRRPTIS